MRKEVIKITYGQTIKKIDFLNKRMRKIGAWYKWTTEINWDKINEWCKLFNYKEGEK